LDLCILVCPLSLYCPNSNNSTLPVWKGNNVPTNSRSHHKFTPMYRNSINRIITLVNKRLCCCSRPTTHI
jgi:hypothetical protein